MSFDDHFKPGTTSYKTTCLLDPSPYSGWLLSYTVSGQFLVDWEFSILMTDKCWWGALCAALYNYTGSNVQRKRNSVLFVMVCIHL